MNKLSEQEVRQLKTVAESYRSLYISGKCTREVAKTHIMPYIDYANGRSKELAKKYNQKPKLISLVSYLR